MPRRDVLQRVLVTALCLTAGRALTLVPLPGIDLHGAIPTEGVSVVALGLDPYVGALAVIVLTRAASSTFNSIVRDGSSARYRVWEALITAAVAAGYANRYTRELRTTSHLLLPVQADGLTWLGPILALTAGTLALYGLGQLINFRGVAVAGRSTGPLLIFGLYALVRRFGDFASAVAHHSPGFGLGDNLRYLLLPMLAIGLTVLTVAVNRAVRRIPIDVGGRSRGGGPEHQSLPFRLLASGIVVPVVLAGAIVHIPNAVADFLSSSPMAAVRSTAAAVRTYWHPDGSLVAVDLVYLAVHASLIIALAIIAAWSWTDPNSIATELRKHGATIPGLRPDGPTATYLGRILTRLSFIGGVYLALAVVISPVLAAWTTGIPRSEAYFDGFAVVLTAGICPTIVRGLEESGKHRLRRPR